MSTYAGEQLGINDAVTLAGGKNPWDYPAGFGYAWDRWDSNSASTELVTGDDVYVYSYGTSLLQDGDALGECNWIVDVSAATGVTVEVYQGYDTDWSYDAAAIAAGWALEAITLTAGRNLVPLSMARRTYAALSIDGAPLLRLKVTAGSITIDRVMLQVEPPDGLKVQTGYHLGDWLTPPTIFQPARVQRTTNWFTGVSTHSFTHDWNSTPTGHVDHGWAPSRYEDVVEAWNNLAPSSTQDTGLASPAGGIFLAEGSWTALAEENFPHNDVDPLEYWASTSRVVSTATAHWESFPDFRQNPTSIPGVPGRDFVFADGGILQWNPDQVTQTVGWRSGVVRPRGRYQQDQYTQDANGSAITSGWTYGLISPHGDIYNVTGVTSFATGPNVNPNLEFSFDGYTDDGSVQFPVTPSPGSDVVISVSLALGEPTKLSPPYGTDSEWVEFVRESASLMQVGWCDTGVGLGGRTVVSQSTPQLILQMPDYRLKVPDFTPSPDAVTPAPPPALLPALGSILFDTPNLSVEADGVGVHFGTT